MNIDEGNISYGHPLVFVMWFSISLFGNYLNEAKRLNPPSMNIHAMPL